VDSEINTHPGETVSICVERNYSLFSTTANLVLDDSEGNLVTESAQSLLFGGGSTQVCFDFTAPEDALGTYFYRISGVDKPLLLKAVGL